MGASTGTSRPRTISSPRPVPPGAGGERAAHVPARAEGVAELIAAMAELQQEGSARERRERAMTTLASMLGAVIIARGVSDPELRDTMLEVMRRQLLRRAVGARARRTLHAR